MDMTYFSKICHVFFLRLHLYDTCSFQSSVLQDKTSEAEKWGWWKGCGGGRLTREERMTARIIKNVLLLRYLEASLPFQLPLSNNSLVTSLHCQTPRLLTRLWHWQRGEKGREMLCGEQFNFTHLLELNLIYLIIFHMCSFLFTAADNSIGLHFVSLFVCQSTVI